LRWRRVAVLRRPHDAGVDRARFAASRRGCGARAARPSSGAPCWWR
jgi:hypothetical protein